MYWNSVRSRFSPKTLTIAGIILIALVLPLIVFISNQEQDVRSRASEPSSSMFTNPIIAGGDPWVIYKDGYYYFTRSGDHLIDIFKSKTLTGIAKGKKVTVYEPTSGPASKQIWAPELHFLNDKWYIYFAADDGNEDNHRMYVLEAKTDDPQGEYALKGKIYDPNADYKSFDGSVFEYDGQLYFITYGLDPVAYGGIYIARMSNPWTLSSSRVKIAVPEYGWEMVGWPQIEAPEALQHDGRLFIVYSASSVQTPDYKLGLLTYTGSNILSKYSWTKKSTPVFQKTDKVFAPGHNAFTKSPDGEEDWIMYHARDTADLSRQRTVRVQKFTWNDDGTPNFGPPIAPGVQIRLPSSEGSSNDDQEDSSPPSRPDTDGEKFTLSGKVFIDKNNSGEYDRGEDLVDGVEAVVYKKTPSGQYDLRCCSKSTNDQGEFSIEDRTPGEYQVTISVPSGYKAVENPQIIALGPSGTVSFALQKRSTPTPTPTRTPTPTSKPTPTTPPQVVKKFDRVTLRGTVFKDSDKDGTFDRNERGYEGVKVSVDKKTSSGNFDLHCCSATTNEDGEYSIPNRTLGIYQIAITLPPAYKSRAIRKFVSFDGTTGEYVVNFDIYR